jgi:hypothetical protein
MNAFQSMYKPPAWLLAFSLSAIVVGCGSGSDSAAPAAPVTPVANQAGAVCAGADCVPLGTAGNYAILTMQGTTTTGTSAITGHVGSAAAASSSTGFSETLDASGTFATSAQVTGKMYAIDYAPPTPAELTTATATDAAAAFNDVDNNKTVGVGNLDLGTAGNITGVNFAPGVYEWSAGGVVVDAAGITLTGGPTAVWVFKIPAGITMNPGATVTLAGGALPQNVFWRAGGVVALGTTASLKGIVLSGSSVTLDDGATVNGRLIASTNVTLIHNTVTRPAL